MKHAKYSASGFKSGRLCPGKDVMCRGLQNKSSSFADEGTQAHNVFEALIKGNPAPDCPPDMLDAVSQAISWVRDLIPASASLHSECTVNYSEFLECPRDEGWGTADLHAVADNILYVLDYKHGAGVPVSAECNDQLILYALGVLSKLAEFAKIMGEPVQIIDRVVMGVLQPRVSSRPETIVVPTSTLHWWAKQIGAPAVAKRQEAQRESINGIDAIWEAKYLNPSKEACQFCPARATCPAVRNQMFEVCSISPDQEPTKQPEIVRKEGAEWYSFVLKNAEFIKSQIGAVESAALAHLNAGNTVPGFRLGHSRPGNRAWIDAAQALSVLSSTIPKEMIQELVNPPEIKSPAQVEKTLKKAKLSTEKIKELTSRHDPHVIIVPLADASEEILVNHPFQPLE